jgi:hypothetical protein
LFASAKINKKNQIKKGRTALPQRFSPPLVAGFGGILAREKTQKKKPKKRKRKNPKSQREKGRKTAPKGRKMA